MLHKIRKTQKSKHHVLSDIQNSGLRRDELFWNTKGTREKGTSDNVLKYNIHV